MTNKVRVALSIAMIGGPAYIMRHQRRLWWPDVHYAPPCNIWWPNMDCLPPRGILKLSGVRVAVLYENLELFLVGILERWETCANQTINAVVQVCFLD